MICEATYDSLESIPETLRDEFEQVNGKWQLKQSAIPGVGPLFNQGLAANEQRAVGQVKARNEKIRSLEAENNELKDKLTVLDSPGNKVLSKSDAETFDAYTNLGTPTELKAKLAKLPDLEDKVQKFETTESLTKVTKANGLGEVKLNPDVLTEWLAGAKGVTAFVKTEERTDAKGAKVNVEVPYLRVETSEDGKTQVSEKELLTFAKAELPEWKYNALVNGAPQQEAKPATGIIMPDLGSAKAGVAPEEKERPVDRYNKARAARPSPFAKPLGVLAAPAGK